MINPGDSLAVSITDPPAGFTTTVRDLTTDQTGFMTASAANGFMNTNIADCSGTPFTFHAEYSSAKIQNQVPWAALEGGVLMEQEIGHSEVCNSVANQDPTVSCLRGRPDLQRPADVYRHLRGRVGRLERQPARARAAAPSARTPTTQGPTGPVACPTNNCGHRRAVRVRRRHLLPEGIADRGGERHADHGGHAGQLLRGQPVPER